MPTTGPWRQSSTKCGKSPKISSCAPPKSRKKSGRKNVPNRPYLSAIPHPFPGVPGSLKYLYHNHHPRTLPHHWHAALCKFLPMLPGHLAGFSVLGLGLIGIWRIGIPFSKLENHDPWIPYCRWNIHAGFSVCVALNKRGLFPYSRRIDLLNSCKSLIPHSAATSLIGMVL